MFDYFIHAMDDHGFLRTRYCYWDKKIDDRSVLDDIKTILITTKTPFDFENETEYYVKEGGIWEDYILTGLKMQLFYYDNSDENQVIEDIEWSEQLGYRYPIKVEL